MALLDDFKGATIFGKIAFILLLLAVLCVYIAFTCTGWGENNSTSGMHWGLWRACTKNDYYTPTCVQLDGWANDWWAGTQALSIIGFIGINVAFFLLVLLIFTSKCKGNKDCLMASAIICLVTGVLFLIGCIVFGVNFRKYFKDYSATVTVDYWLSYAFGLGIVSCLLEIVAGVLLLIDGCKGGGGTSPSA